MGEGHGHGSEEQGVRISKFGKEEAKRDKRRGRIVWYKGRHGYHLAEFETPLEGVCDKKCYLPLIHSFKSKL